MSKANLLSYKLMRNNPEQYAVAEIVFEDKSTAATNRLHQDLYKVLEKHLHIIAPSKLSPQTKTKRKL